MAKLSRGKLIISSIALVGCLMTAFALYRQVRQARLDHKLIRALRHLDSASALEALTDGANANVHEVPETSPSFLQMLKSVFVRPRRDPATDAPSALMVAINWRELDAAHEANFWIDNHTPVFTPPQDPRVIAALLDHGADMRVKNEIGLSPIHIAAWVGESTTVRLLLEHGINPNVQGDEGDFQFSRPTPLILAIDRCWGVKAKGNLAIIRTLIDKGADIDTLRDDADETALSLAKERENPEVLALLKAALKSERRKKQ